MLYGRGETGTSRVAREKVGRRVDFFKVRTRECGIGLQSGTRETPDIVVIEAWVNGRSSTGLPPRTFGCVRTLVRLAAIR